MHQVGTGQSIKKAGRAHPAKSQNSDSISENLCLPVSGIKDHGDLGTRMRDQFRLYIEYFP